MFGTTIEDESTRYAKIELPFLSLPHTSRLDSDFSPVLIFWSLNLLISTRQVKMPSLLFTHSPHRFLFTETRIPNPLRYGPLFRER